MDNTMSLDHRLKLARTALAAAEANARDPTKNATYWNTQVDREKKLVESLEAEMREPSDSNDSDEPADSTT